MTNKLLAVVVVVLLFVTAFAASISYFSRLPRRSPEQSRRGEGGQPTTSSSLRVPEPNETPQEKGLAIPATAQPILPGSKNKIRTFHLSGDNNSFEQKKIVVFEGDIIRIQFMAVDRSYDVSIPAFGLKQEVGPGETKTIEFQALSAGSYPFLCETCKNDKTKGTLIVIPKS